MRDDIFLLQPLSKNWCILLYFHFRFPYSHIIFFSLIIILISMLHRCLPSSILTLLLSLSALSSFVLSMCWPLLMLSSIRAAIAMHSNHDAACSHTLLSLSFLPHYHPLQEKYEIVTKPKFRSLYD